MGGSSAGPSKGTGTHHGSRGSPACEHPRREPHVPHLAADRALDGTQLGEKAALGRGTRVVRGHPPERRLHRRQPARERGEAQRPADVVAVVYRPEPHRRGGRRSTGRSTWRGLVVPGIEGPAAQRVVRGPAHRKLRGIGAPHDDCAGVEQVARHRRMVRSDQVSVRGQAVRGCLPGDVDILLDGDRDPVQRPEGRAAVGLPVLPFGRAQRLVGAVGDDRVDAPVVPGDAPQHRFRDLDARHLARPNHRGELDRAPAPQILVHRT